MKLFSLVVFHVNRVRARASGGLKNFFGDTGLSEHMEHMDVSTGQVPHPLPELATTSRFKAQRGSEFP